MAEQEKRGDQGSNLISGEPSPGSIRVMIIITLVIAVVLVMIVWLIIISS